MEEKRLPIGPEEVRRAGETLRAYRRGKQTLERRIIDGEQWWKLRHWEATGHGGDGDPRPVSGWLVNVCLAKHADAMDAYPEGLCLPREPGDRDEAAVLSDILPVVLDGCDYEKVWSDCWWYKLKHGASCKGIFWDPGRLGGLGDVTIRRVDLLNLFWEPGVTDIQKSRNVFCTELRDKDLLEAEYPQLRGRLGGSGLGQARYLYDDTVDTTDKAVVVDWYYKRRRGGRTVLHYAKFCEGALLFSSENEAAAARESSENVPIPYENGWYDHGKYPFVFDVLFPQEGSPAGFGYIALCRSAQEQIDLMNNAILKNTLAAATPRWFIRNDGAVNEAEYLDLRQPFIHTNAGLGQDSILPVSVQGLSDVYVSCLNNKIGELKEVSGNRDVANGGTASGVTAASAIAAMQEQAGKLSRDQIQQSYRAFREELLLVIELMRQFYDAPRQFRITGRLGEPHFVTFDNSGLVQQSQGVEFGVDMGRRTPLFDIQVAAQRQSSYAKAVYNELGIQLYQLGFFNPDMAEQALGCLEIMDFEGREAMMARIARAAAARQAQRAALAAQAAATRNATNDAAPGGEGEANARSGAARGKTPRNAALRETDRLGNLKEQEHPFVAQAREASRNASRPRS